MTTPGYPDWERVTRVGGDFVTVSRTAISSTVILGPFNVQQWSTIMMWALTPVGSDFYQINWLWYDTQNQNNLLSSIFQIIGPNMEFPLPVTVGGPWLKIEIVPQAGGNNAVPVFSFTGMRNAPSAFEVNTYSAPILRDNSATPINTVVTFTGANIHYGNAILTINPPAGPLSAVFFRFYNLGVPGYQSVLAYTTLAAGTTTVQEISMHAGPWQLAFTNGATAQSVLVSIMPKAGK